jgi:exopolyphosphatase/pppGpp-phosphohydrolase
LQKTILEKTAINLHVVSGTEEAILVPKSVRHITQLEQFVPFDIECGSVEMAKFDNVRHNTWNFPISAIDLSRRHNFETDQSAI